MSEGEAVEAVALNSVVSSQDAHQDLHAPEDDHHIEILDCRALRRGGFEGQEWVFFRIRPVNEFLLLRRIPPDKAADSRQQADETEYAPEHCTGGWYVANQRLMRPIVCVGCLDPGRSVLQAHDVHQKNAASCFCFAALINAPLRDGILRTACCKDIGVVCPKLLKRGCAIGISVTRLRAAS